MPSQPKAPTRTIIRYPLTSTRFDGTVEHAMAGELLAVAASRSTTLGYGWSAYTLADLDTIPTPRRLAIITTGMPMPAGEWRYLCPVPTELYVWFVFEAVQP